jgi:hypothetical protein
MDAKIISYNSVKLTDLQQEIDNIPGATPYDGQMTPITLTSSPDNHGEAEQFAGGDHTHYLDTSTLPKIEPNNSQTTPITLDPEKQNQGTAVTYARGDHTHFLNLDDISLDLKTPVKIMDSAGNIKKVILEQTVSTPSSSIKTFYFKFPIITIPSDVQWISSEINFKCQYYAGAGTQFSTFKVYIKYTTPVISLWFNIDNSLANGRYNITNKSVVYYTDEQEVTNYYLKLEFDTAGARTNMTYMDLSTTGTIPADFKYDNMVVTSLPSETVFSGPSFYTTNVFIANVTVSNSTSVYVLTSSKTSNPTVTHPQLYSGGQSYWESTPIIIDDTNKVYAWKSKS